jgi:hypothetical protein
VLHAPPRKNLPIGPLPQPVVAIMVIATMAIVIVLCIVRPPVNAHVPETTDLHSMVEQTYNWMRVVQEHHVAFQHQIKKTDVILAKMNYV